jgi:anaerobic selenocysteine-containing dehydrogenase
MENAPAANRVVNLSRLGHALTELNDPPVKALFVYNCNPAVTVPDQARVLRGLEREDLFTVVFEQVLTDTTLYADVILPNTTFLEHYDIARAYGPLSMVLARPAIEPLGESRPNADVFGELIERLDLGREGDARGELEEMVQVMGAIPGSAGEGLREHGVAEPPFGGRPVQFVDVLPRTADQKIHLWPEGLDAQAPAGLYGYQPDPTTAAFPLALISPASDRTISSTLGELPRPESMLEMHPDDADARGIADGVPVRIFNALGEVRCKARVATWLRPGIVSLPKGLWFRHTANGRTSNTLIPDTLSDLGGGACYNDARVQVEAIPQ